jgi:hypothetical protein
MRRLQGRDRGLMALFWRGLGGRLVSGRYTAEIEGLVLYAVRRYAMRFIDKHMTGNFHAFTITCRVVMWSKQDI